MLTHTEMGASGTMLTQTAVVVMILLFGLQNTLAALVEAEEIKLQEMMGVAKMDKELTPLVMVVIGMKLVLQGVDFMIPMTSLLPSNAVLVNTLVKTTLMMKSARMASVLTHLEMGVSGTIIIQTAVVVGIPLTSILLSNAVVVEALLKM